MLSIIMFVDNYDLLNCQIVFSGFYASMFPSNMATFAKYVTDAEIQKDNADKNLDYEYKTNVNILIVKLKENLVLALLEPNLKRETVLLQKMFAEISRNRTPIRPDQQFEGKLPIKKRFFMNNKAAL